MVVLSRCVPSLPPHARRQGEVLLLLLHPPRPAALLRGGGQSHRLAAMAAVAVATALVATAAPAQAPPNSPSRPTEDGVKVLRAPAR